MTTTKVSLILTATFICLGLLHSKAQEQNISPLVASHFEHSKMKASSLYGLHWIQLGPALNGARVEAVQADPKHPGTIYVAFGSGGLWKTTNNGLSWQPIFENMPSLGIGDIALAPSDPQILYVGTGESLKKARNFTMPGNGIYRSSDSGKSWQYRGLSDSWHIGEIAVHPQNPDIVVVAVLGHFWSSNDQRGIYRTEDGGQNWKQVLFIDENTGANDIVFSPSDPNAVYATMWENYPGINGLKSGVYKSTDTGNTWIRVTKGIRIDKNTGRIGVAVSHQDATKAYVFVDQRNQENDEGSGEIYRTIDGGKTWTKTNEQGIKSLSVIGWYFMDIYVDPQNDDEIYTLGVRLLHSKDGGKTHQYIGGTVNHLTPSPAQTLHLDHCEMWINPGNPKELLLGNDGGLYHSYDKGSSWLHLNNIPTGEFYDIEIDNSEPYLIYGGTQDDATVVGSAIEWNPKFDDTWEYLWIDAWSGGDGCITLIDPEDQNTIYFSMQNGGARRMNLAADTSQSIRPRFHEKDSIELRYNFITPYMLSPHKSHRLYMAGNYVMQSDNKGEKWNLISPDLIEKNLYKENEIAAGALAESFFEEGVIYMGTDKGTVWRTLNGGREWENISGDLPNNYIRKITPSRHKKERVYLQQTGLNYDDFSSYLYVSENYGNSWKSIKNNLPDHPVNVIIEDPRFENILFAGTYRGVYISENSGLYWSYFGKNMPDASIADIEIDKKTNDLIAATHGRGIYVVNLNPVYHRASNQMKSNYLFDLPVAQRPRVRDTHKEIDQQSVKKTSITFWLEDPENVVIEVANMTDSILWIQHVEGVKGFNQYRWDLVTNEKASDLPYFIHYKNYLKKGSYRLRLKNTAGDIRKSLMVRD